MSKRPSGKKTRSRAWIVWKRWGDWRKLAIAGGTGLFIAVLLTVQLLPNKVSVRLNEPAQRDIIAPRYVHYPDWEKTRELRQRIAEQVPRVYSAILGANVEARETTASFFDTAFRLRSEGDKVPLADRLARLSKLARGIPVELAKSALSLPPDQLQAAKDAAGELIDQATAKQILPETLEQTRALIRYRASTLPQPPAVRRLAGAVAAQNLAPNQLYNAEDT